jgi:hypothetical protein
MLLFTFFQILEELGSFFEKIRDTDTSSFASQPGQISYLIEHFNGYVAYRLMFGPVVDNQVNNKIV